MASNIRYLNSKNDDSNAYKVQIFRYQRKKVFIFLSIFLLIAACIIGYRLYLESKIFTSYDVLSVKSIPESGSAETISFNNYVIRYSMDGVTCFDKNGNILWAEAYTFRTPIAAVCEGYLAIAEQNGTKIYIFNESGLQGEAATEYPIVHIEVAAQGVVAVILEHEGIQYIKLYSAEGRELAANKTFLEGSKGYPLDIGFSMDGKKLVVSYLEINNNQLGNSLAFYNYSEVGQDFEEQLVGVFGAFSQDVSEDVILGDVIIPEVAFLNNDTICAFSDKKIFIIKMIEKPSTEVVQIELENEIVSIFHSDKYIGFVYEDSAQGAFYRFYIYDLNGKNILQQPLYQDYKQIEFDGDQIVVMNESSIQIVTFKGIERFSYTFEKSIALMKRISDFRYIMVSDTSISEIRLK